MGYSGNSLEDYWAEDLISEVIFDIDHGEGIGYKSDSSLVAEFKELEKVLKDKGLI